MFYHVWFIFMVQHPPLYSQVLVSCKHCSRIECYMLFCIWATHVLKITLKTVRETPKHIADDY